MKTKHAYLTLCKVCIIATVTLFLTVGTASASYFSFGVGGGPYYDSYPGYYNSDVVYIPGHWEYGYWVPGHYVEQAYGPPVVSSPGVWFNIGGGGGYHHHHH